MFIRVDLPAPFSPSSAWTSPRFTSKDTRSFATTPGNSLRMSRISRTRSPSALCSLIASKKERADSSPALSVSCASSSVARGVRRAFRRRDDDLGEDLRLVRLHQRDPGRRGRIDLADADAVVLEVQQNVLATMPPGGSVIDRVLDADI